MIDNEKTEYNLDTLIKKFEAYHNIPSDAELIRKAYAYAAEKHKTQVRKSGEPYITHPLRVACTIADLGLDAQSVCAALLHDVIEDTDSTYDEVAQRFGETVAMLVDGVTKLGKIPTTSKEEQQIENLRKMFFAMAKDVRVIVIKLADRLHNMQTLKYMPENKQRYIARETLEVYAPLAHRLGMSKIKWELEDTALRYIDPVGYYEIVDKIAQKRSEREKFIEKIIEILKDKLTKVLDEPPIIEGRAKHFYSIYRKMFMQNKTIDELYDLFAVRVIVDTVAECYAVLGTVHELFKPVPGRFKDYIAMPKPNMYQSLHSTLIGPGGTPFEIQIRTKEMHHTAENGIAAHWKYKEGVTASSDMDKKLEWIKQLLEIQKENNAEDFMEALKIDMFSDEVFVFSPKGDVISLPINATPIDFAYSIHSAVGNHMVGAKVNGKIVTLDYTLQNGDIVEIITSKTSNGPNLDWIKICKTSQAKNKINQWFKKVNREENIQKGREALEHELKKSSLPLTFLEDKELISSLAKKYGFNNSEDLLAGIGYGSSNAGRFVTRFKTECKKKFATEESRTAAELIPVVARPRGETNNSGVIVQGIDNCLIRFSHCCNPVPGDKIVGYVTRGRGVAIHRADCINMLNALNNKQESARFIPVKWADDTDASFLSTLTVTAGNRSNLLLDIMGALSELKLTATGVNARTGKNNLAIIEVTLEIADTEQLNKIIKKIKQIDGVLSIVRRRQ